MKKDMLTLLTNNLTAMAIHLCTCVVLLPFGFIWENSVWDDLLLDRGLKSIALNVLIVGIHTLILLCAYFRIGKKYINSTHNALLDILSVVLITVILTVVVLAFYQKPLAGIVVIPIYPLSETISFFCGINLKYCYLIMSIVPSLVMWAGIVSKKG